MADYFVKIKARDNHGEDFVTYRIISGTALAAMKKKFANTPYPFEWKVGYQRFIRWEFPHDFEKSIYVQNISDNDMRILLEVFNFYEFPWPVPDEM